MSRSDIFSSRRGCWIVWVCVVAATIAVHMATLRISPPFWQDEVQIIDYGRVDYAGSDKTYGMSWLMEGRPHELICRLGGLIQETACRWAGFDAAGPRISAVAGAVLASMAMLGWLMARGTVPWIALACSLLFLWEPAFVQSYRGARVDSWAMAFMICALWAVRGGGKRHEARGERLEGKMLTNGKADMLKERATDRPLVTRHPSQAQAWRALGCYAFAGVFVVLSGLTWVSGIILLPLLLLELVESARMEGRLSVTVLARSVFCVALFALVAAFLILLPVWRMIPEMIHDLLLKQPAQGMNRGLGHGLVRLLFASGKDPWLPLFALGAMIGTRRWGLMLAFVAGLGFVLLTGPYIFRGIYLLPYLALAVACGANDLWKQTIGHVSRKFVIIVMGGLLFWCGAVSLAARTWSALREAKSRDPRILEEVAATGVIGDGPKNVYVDPWEFYYAGRKLGWRQYRSFFWHNMSDRRFLDLLRSMDFVIFDAANPRQPSAQEMADLGFVASEVGAAAKNSWQGESAGQSGYGRYIFYSRK